MLCADDVMQGEKGGRGGLDSTPSDEREAPEIPEHLRPNTSLDAGEALALAIGEGISPAVEAVQKQDPMVEGEKRPTLLPRETGEDIGMGSPVPLSKEAVGVITKLRGMKVRSRPSFLHLLVRSPVLVRRMQKTTIPAGKTSYSAPRHHSFLLMLQRR
jgi:hypothetical protein